MFECNLCDSLSNLVKGKRVRDEEAERKAIQIKREENRKLVDKIKKDRKSLISSVLGRETGDIRDSYSLGKIIDKHQFGPIREATDNRTGVVYACKVIPKRKLLIKEEVENVRREVAILHHLSGHSDFVQLKAAYEDHQQLYLVLERCNGDELFDRIVAKGKYSERQAASVCRNILSIIETCHSLGVMHRDLKPENFLYDDKKEDSKLKLADFNEAVFVKPREYFHDVVGSAYYLAPEVLRRRYSLEADVWSVGVILYILLSGQCPFSADDEKGVFDAILRGQVDLQSPPWPSISEQAKDLVRKLLKQDPSERLTATEALRHSWVKVGGSAPDKPLDVSVALQLRHFSGMNKLKKKALRVIASNLSEDEIKGMREMFKIMDVDKSGTITYTELKAGLAMYGANMPEEEIKLFMEAADVDGSGSINYEEFVSATLHSNKDQKDENLFQAFQTFDEDGSGFISMDELRKALLEDGELEGGDIHNIISEVDKNNDGKIDYEEFVTMMRPQSFKNGVLRSASGNERMPLTFK